LSAQPQELWRLYPMHEDHLPFVLDIEQRAYEFPWSQGIFADCLRSGYSAWVIENPFHEVMGYALMTMAAGEAHILNLCVAPEYQGQGLGRYLLEHLVTLARAADVGLLLLEVRLSNTAGIALYRAAGFQQLGQRKAYYPARDGREDALVLGLNLKPPHAS
jgi:[ribosomal protein S18]-alanine N-acetyltransferase